MTFLETLVSDADVLLAMNEINRLQKLIDQYHNDTFQASIKSIKRHMIVPKTYYPSYRSSYYDLGSHLVQQRQKNNYRCNRKSLPIVESWKTYKGSKSTVFILYESAFSAFIYESLKDDNMGEFKIIEKGV